MMANFKVSLKERVYFSLIVAISLFVWGSGIYYSYKYYHMIDFKILIGATVFLVYGLLIFLYFFFAKYYFRGHLLSNSIKVTYEQFPDVYEVLQQQSRALALKKTPDFFVMQSDGVLNAFAIKLFRKKAIVLYSEIFEEAYSNGLDAVKFIIGHELGHIKRGHLSFFNRVILFPGKLIPFLSSAYSRACEVTCDRIGCVLSPAGAEAGLLILVGGRFLSRKINVDVLIRNYRADKGFSTWFYGIIASHPPLIKRINAIRNIEN